MAMPAATETGGSRNEAEVILEVHGLTKVFGSGRAAVRAVDGLSLSVRRGELVLVMGPSGSGKTTLLTLIGGLLRPTSGIVRVNGLDISSLKERQLTKFRRHYLGFIFQSFNLLESLNARENVEAALNFAGIGGRKARKRATALLTDLGMADRLRARPHTLSGGERQRVSIARALANDPQLILADEPTANLDSRHGHESATCSTATTASSRPRTTTSPPNTASATSPTASPRCRTAASAALTEGAPSR